MRDIYLANDPAEAQLLLDKAIEGCRTDWVEEIRSLGTTLAKWRTEILNHHLTGASNGPTEGLNLLIKKVKRARPRLPVLHQLPPADTATRRRRRLERDPPTRTPDPRTPSPVKCDEPNNQRRLHAQTADDQLDERGLDCVVSWGVKS